MKKLILKIKKIIWQIKLVNYFDKFIINLDVVRNPRKLKYYYSVYKFCNNIVEHNTLESFDSKIEFMKLILIKANRKYSNAW